MKASKHFIGISVVKKGLVRMSLFCKRYVLFQPDGQVIEFQNGEEYGHKVILLHLQRTPVQNPEVPGIVVEAVENDIKPKRIISKLQIQQVPMPSKK